jgi:hypothetical protein
MRERGSFVDKPLGCAAEERPDRSGARTGRTAGGGAGR